MYQDPYRLRDDLCHYLAGSARTFRDILDDGRHSLPPSLRSEIELLENFCRFAVAEFNRVIGRRLVQRACRDYKRSGDPIHAWGAFHMCRA
ncbi:MAG: hypothetical protein FJX67_17610 [Alphaproteobacteria bacterium]|nr:hypothetical protein [Alphaproteobacteria bacterium]